MEEPPVELDFRREAIEVGGRSVGTAELLNKLPVEEDCCEKVLLSPVVLLPKVSGCEGLFADVNPPKSPPVAVVVVFVDVADGTVVLPNKPPVLVVVVVVFVENRDEVLLD